MIDHTFTGKSLGRSLLSELLAVSVDSTYIHETAKKELIGIHNMSITLEVPKNFSVFVLF